MQGGVNYNGNTLLTGGINVNTTGNIQALNVQVTENGERTITPPEGVDGYAPITIDTNVPTPEPVLDTLNVTSNGTYTPPSGVDGYDEVNVSVPTIEPVLDTLNVTSNGTYTPPSGVDGYDEVNVSVPTPEPVLDTLNVTSNGTYTPPSGVDGYDEVNVSVSGYTIKTLSTTPTSIASFADGTANPLKSLTASIVPVQAGSGDPSPTNVRPISGWTRCEVNVTGINIWDEEWEVGSINNTTGQDLSRNDTFRSKNYIPVKPNTTYYAYCGDILGESGMRIPFYAYDINKNYIGRTTPNAVNNTTFTTPSDCYFIRFRTGNDFPHSAVYQNDITINISDASVNGHYYPYNVNSHDYTIPFTDGQGQSVEVFGGSVDVVNGVVTPCPYYASYNGEQLTGEWISDRDVYSPNTSPTIGAQVVNIGATGTPFYAQPTSIKSLDGVNNVWASTGDVEELKYFADL